MRSLVRLKRQKARISFASSKARYKHHKRARVLLVSNPACPKGGNIICLNPTEKSHASGPADVAFASASASASMLQSSYFLLDRLTPMDDHLDGADSI